MKSNKITLAAGVLSGVSIRIAFAGILFCLAGLASPAEASGKIRKRPVAVNPIFSLDLCGLEKELGKRTFSESFSHTVDIGAIRQSLQMNRELFGKCTSYEGKAGEEAFTLQWKNAKASLNVSYDSKGRVAHLWLAPADVILDSFEEIRAFLQSQLNKVSIFVYSGGKVLFASNESEALKTLKSKSIPVLFELSKALKRGALQLQTVTKLAPTDRSGWQIGLNSFPDDSNITVDTLRNLMVINGDDVAMDTLIRLLDRKSLNSSERKYGYFLTTREMNWLKGMNDPKSFFMKDEKGENVRSKFHALDGEAIGPVAAVAAPEDYRELDRYYSTKVLCEDFVALKDEPEVLKRIGDLNRNNIIDGPFFFDWSERDVQFSNIWRSDSSNEWSCISVSGTGPKHEWVNFKIFISAVSRLQRLASKKIKGVRD